MSKGNLTALAQAALAVDEELQRFELLSASAQRLPLDSKRNLEKAARVTGEAAESQKRLGELVQAFMTALNAARDQNQHSAEKLQARGSEIQRRSEVYAALYERFAALGSEGASISGEVGKLSGVGPSRSREVLPELAEVEARLGGVVDQATALVGDCREADFGDLVSQVDSLKQQVQSARNRVALLRRQLAGPAPPAPN